MISLGALTTPGNRGAFFNVIVLIGLYSLVFRQSTRRRGRYVPWRKKEDFSNVRLKRPDLAKTPGQAVEMKPHNNLMLIQVRGR